MSLLWAAAAIPAHTISYEYDYGTMTLTSVTDTTMTPGQKTVQYAYDAKGRLQTTTYANSASQEYAYNSDNRLDRLTTRGAAGYLINDQQYHYTPGGLLTEISAYQNGSTYSYDALNQVETESTYLGAGGPQGNNLYAQRTYAYDANGNRTSEQRTDVLPNVGATAVSRSYAPATADDRMVSYAQSSTTPALQYPVAYTCDARGNRLAQSSSLPSTHPSISYGYDHFSRMTGCTNGTTSVVYAYDALGRKVKRLKRDATIYPDSTYYVYDGLDPVCMVEFNPAHTECTTVTWLTRGLGVAPGIGNIVAQQRYTINFNGTASQPVMHYYHPNHRGDTAYLTDVSGVKAATYIYDAFGRLLSASSIQDPGSSIIYLFSGKEWDSDAQLYYFGFRWYDPDSGTWTTKDPLNFKAGDINVQRFACNAPVLLVDCYGLSFWGTVGSVAGKMWSAPNTIVGATLGTVGMAFGGDIPNLGNNAIQFDNSIFAFPAFALGNVIFYNGECKYSASSIGPEEEQHTLQAEILGPLYLPAHVTLGTASMIINGDFSNEGWHQSNPLEYGPHENNPPTIF